MPRKINSAEIEYKEAKVKGLVDKVTAKLSGSQSGIFTKLATRYKKIDNALKKLGDAREELNEEVKMHMTELFDAEDETLTRVVETVSMTANLSKRTPAGTKQVETFDAAGMIEELYETMPELTEQLDYLTKKYTKIKEVQVSAKSPALRVKVNEDHNDSADFYNKVEKYSEIAAYKVMSKLDEYDQKISHIQQKIA